MYWELPVIKSFYYYDMIKEYKWTIWLVLLTIPLLFIAVLFMGGGHGTYIPAIGLFPFGLIGSLFYDRITTAFVIIAFLQYPVYGFIIDKAIQKRKGKIVLPLIVLLHITLAVLIVVLKGESWI